MGRDYAECIPVPRIKESPIDCMYGCLFDRVQTKPIFTNFNIRRKNTMPQCLTVVETKDITSTVSTLMHTIFFLLFCIPNLCLPIFYCPANHMYVFRKKKTLANQIYFVLFRQREKQTFLTPVRTKPIHFISLPSKPNFSARPTVSKYYQIIKNQI